MSHSTYPEVERLVITFSNGKEITIPKASFRGLTIKQGFGHGYVDVELSLIAPSVEWGVVSEPQAIEAPRPRLAAP